MPVITLTQSQINHHLQCPAGKQRVEFCDASLPGLYVLVSAAGNTATFFLRYKDSTKKTCHQNIGRTSDITLADARKQAMTLKVDIAAGKIPGKQVEVPTTALTFTAFFETHYLPFVKPRKRSWQKDDALFRLRLKGEFGDLPLSGITRQQVQSFHNDLKAGGLAGATCDHYVKLLRHTLNLAVEWGMLSANPIARLHLFNEDNQVEHYLDEAELERLLTVLRTDPRRSVCLVALFLLSTGARLNEALKATWSQIDQGNRLWRIPARNSKSKRARSVPLNDSALDVLNRVATQGKHEQIFVSDKTGEPLRYVHKVWERLRIKAELPQLRLHDLRHQYASFLVNSGRTLYEVQHILGHADSQVTQRYAHLSMKSLQEAANTASAMIERGQKTA